MVYIIAMLTYVIPGIGAKWVMADQLAFSLATAGITLAAALQDDTLPHTIFKTYKLLKDVIEEYEGSLLKQLQTSVSAEPG